MLIPVVQSLQLGSLTAGWASALAIIALHWFIWTLAVVLGRVAYLAWKHDLRISMIWFVKLITDPFTDIVAYFPRRAQRV